MSDASKDVTTADVLMMAGQVVQGLRNAKRDTLRAEWADWAVGVVEHMGRVVHWADGKRERNEIFVAYAHKLEFLLAVAAACATHEIGDLIHDNAELMTAANVEANEVMRLNDKVEGLEADLFSAVRVAYQRGATDWVRRNYRAWFAKLEADPTVAP